MSKNCQKLKNLSATSLMLRTSLSMDSSTNATQFVVGKNEVDGRGNQSIKNLSKKYQKLKNLKGLKNLQRLSV